jgi:hypothetical protein
LTEPSEHHLTFLRPGDGIRWALGSRTGLRSSTWRFWGNKKGDFYVAVRSLGGLVKTSLHRDGWCQTGVTEEYLKKSPHKSPRKLDRWRLPDAPLLNALEIVTPAEELDVFDSEEADPIVWLPAPKPSFVSVVTIVVWRPGTPFDNGERWPRESLGTNPVGIITTPTRSAIAVQGQYSMNGETRQIIETYRSQIKAKAPADLAPGPGVRATLIGNHSNGLRFLAELSVRA